MTEGIRVSCEKLRNLKLQTFLRKWVATALVPTHIRLQIDMDPYSFYWGLASASGRAMTLLIFSTSSGVKV